MTVRELQEAVLKLKQEKQVCILAHTYERQEILEVADYVGDSFGLSRQAAAAEQNTVIMCGVRFMAETVKILSPQKKVFLANSRAGCPMAEQLDPELLAQLKETYPDHAVVAYINTTAELKALCDVCVTSSSAVRILRQIPAKNILFIPDCNLGAWCAEQVPDKKIELVRGGCPTHLRISTEDVRKARRAHPEAELLVHPECLPTVTKEADFVGSTTEIMEYARKGAAREYLIATENSIAEHLQMDCPDKRFYPVSKDCVCHNMLVTTLADVYHCLQGEGEEIQIEESLRLKAKKAIDNMLLYG